MEDVSRSRREVHEPRRQGVSRSRRTRTRLVTDDRLRLCHAIGRQGFRATGGEFPLDKVDFGSCPGSSLVRRRRADQTMHCRRLASNTDYLWSCLKRGECSSVVSSTQWLGWRQGPQESLARRREFGLGGPVLVSHAIPRPGASKA